MACLGVHLALTEGQASRLMGSSRTANESLLEFVREIEKEWDQEWLQETDKAWDGIHRSLTDGKLAHGDTPLHKCVLGVRNLYDGKDYIINFLDPLDVRAVAAAIKDISRDQLRRGYDAMDPESYYYLVRSDDDFDYTWHYFSRLRDFFQKAAAVNRAMLFTVDQ